MNKSTSPFWLVPVSDGGFTVHAAAYGETYHPGVGPMEEARRLYWDGLNLATRLAEPSQDPLVLWDIGLGAAGNVSTILRLVRGQTRPLHVVSFDRTTEPLRFGVSQAISLRYLEGYVEIAQTLLAQQHVSFSNHGQPVDWELRLDDFPSLLQGPTSEHLRKPHAIVFDPHSPKKNPEMWTLPLLRRLRRLLEPSRPCLLATYTRSNMVRVTLLLAGFFVGRGNVPGPQEESTVAASHPEWIQNPLDRDWLERARRSTGAEPLLKPHYYQQPLREETWNELRNHPQFE